MGSPIDVGGQYPSSHFSPLIGLVVNFCYGVMKPVLYASRVLRSNPGCLSFIHFVDFESPPFSRIWAAYIELAGIVPLGSSQARIPMNLAILEDKLGVPRKEGGG